MTAAPTGRAALLGHIRGIIAAHGWAVTGVGEAGQCSTPGCMTAHTSPTVDPSMYTAGLTDAGLPELVLEHVPAAVAQAVLNALARRSLEKALAPGEVHEVPGVPGQFAVEALSNRDGRAVAKIANALYGHKARYLRVVQKATP